jgi:exopolyphosphatase/guanosine-5'-triphosphate,3'-diphosphate pyrophosphatase
MRIAIIDLGTNTFNLLIADTLGRTSWSPVFRIKEGVKLGQGGINHGVIRPDAFERGIQAMQRHYERIRGYHVDTVVALGTSALRDASNGQDFTHEIKKRFDIEVTLITGDQEADYIYKGVRQTVDDIHEKYLILDIGGGSNEFILAGRERYYWKESFKLGMARLMELFHPPDPATPELSEQLERYFDQELTTLFEAARYYQPAILVGASGTFDSLVNIFYSEIYPSEEFLPASQELGLDTFHRLYLRIIRSTREERQHMKGLEPVRRDMIVPAVIFVNYILKKLNFQKLYQSSYSLKEGALWEVMQNM